MKKGLKTVSQQTRATPVNICAESSEHIESNWSINQRKTINHKVPWGQKCNYQKKSAT